jgi:hypothetical protein
VITAQRYAKIAQTNVPNMILTTVKNVLGCVEIVQRYVKKWYQNRYKIVKKWDKPKRENMITLV